MVTTVSTNNASTPHTSYHGQPTEQTLPGFEGAEKRLEVDFCPIVLDAAADPAGLRALSRDHLDEICRLAECTIVSSRTNAAFDAYVLSESSMFVFPRKFVIKTCGTTKLLQCAERLLVLAKSVGLQVLRTKFSRCSYKYPEVQPAPHASWDQECALLQHTFGLQLGRGKAHILGESASGGLQWHVWVAQRPRPEAFPPAAAPLAPRLTLEVCMTALAPARAAIFAKDVAAGGSATSKACTLNSGIRALLPRSEIDDFLFDPCGYSMNALEGQGFANSHVTPEAEFSYASLEVCGYKDMDVKELTEQIAAAFRPGEMVVALHAEPAYEASDATTHAMLGGASTELNNGFGLVTEAAGVSLQMLADGSRVAFHRYRSDASLALNAAAITEEARKAAKAGAEKAALEELVLDLPGADPHAGSATPPPSEADLKRASSDFFSSDDDEAPAAKRSRLAAAAAGVGNADAAVQAAVAQFGAEYIGAGRAAMDGHLAKTVARTGEDAFYVVDLGVVLGRYRTWVASMPRVEPFYAVKCFGDPALLATLAAAGCAFDCASPAEMESVLALGVEPERIIYANACKPPKHLRFARARGVRVTTFDNEAELHKVAAAYPEAELVLRLRADDPAARCPLGDKYGAEEYEVEPLLRLAKTLGLTVKGISFHVGSGATDPNSFRRAIGVAKGAFDCASALGLPPLTLLDIGGGFSGGAVDGAAGGVVMERVAESINSALEEYFPARDGVRVISEPGRYFAETSATLCASVFGRRIRPATEVGADADTHAYWITDGLYGSFNCLLYDHAEVAVRTLVPPPAAAPHHKSTLFGPTCDGLDTVLRGVPLPRLEVGDWVVFDRMGAYTKCAGSNFNGFDVAAIKTYYTFSR